MAKKAQSDAASDSAIAVLFGEDYNVETTDTTTELNQYCQDTPPHRSHGLVENERK